MAEDSEALAELRAAAIASTTQAEDIGDDGEDAGDEEALQPWEMDDGISTSSSPEALQEIMDVAKAAAEAEAELQRNGEDPLAPADEDEGDEDGELEDDGEQEPQDDYEQRTYTHRDAARYARDLDAARNELNQYRAYLQQVQARETAAMAHIQQAYGSDDSYLALSQLKQRGVPLSPQQEATYQAMTGVRQLAGPLYAAAQQQIVGSWSGAFAEAGRYDGMDDNLRRQIQSAAEPRVALQAIYEAGVREGKRRGSGESMRTRAELSSLRARDLAYRPQPAAPDGNVPGHTPNLPPMLNEDGSLNPEFERLASSGKLLGVDLAQGR